MELSRRSFISGATLLGAGALGTSLIGCSSNTSSSSSLGSSSTSHNPVSTEQCDIVVVGSGTAGMCAAARSAELGASVILLEKNNNLGGSSGFAEGVGAINSYMHKQNGIVIDENEVSLTTQEYHHWAADSTVLRRFIKESGATVDWLNQNCGVNFLMATVTAPTSYPSWHLAAGPDGKVARNAASVIAPLETYCKSLGVEIRTSSPATGLISEGNTVNGVYFSDGNDEYAIEASAVILATGGYSNNQEMFERFSNVSFNKIFNWGANGRDGDGISWAMDIDAATHIPSTVMYSCTRVPDTPTFEEKVNWIFSWQPNLRVNDQGLRFMNESLCADFSRVSNAVLSQTKCFSLMDKTYIDMIANTALPVGLDSLGYVGGEPLPGTMEAITQALDDERIFKADTLDELASIMGIDASNLAATVEEYNGYSRASTDLAFAVPPVFLSALSTAPYYAAEILPAMFTSVGGLRVDENLRVLNNEGSRIEGLYAIGGDASSDTGRDYDVGIMSGSQQGWCATGGRLAAEDILSALG